MNGIDTAIASLLASRVDSLLNIAPGAPSTAQAGASALSVDTPVTPGTPEVPTPPPASAQTVLSAVALTLNAIALSGGEATPAILGQVPIWPAAPALDVEMAELPLFDSAGGQSADAGTPPCQSNAANAASTANPTSATGTTATAATSVAASPVPVAALAAALEQTVAAAACSTKRIWRSGWRASSRCPTSPTNRKTVCSIPPRNCRSTGRPTPMQARSPARRRHGAAGPAWHDADRQRRRRGEQRRPRAMPSILSPQAARFVAGEVLANSLSDLSGQPERAALHAAVAQMSDTPTQATQSVASAINAATVPLVRQQLDMLATGQFRWTGEAWPGAKLDWTIQQDGDEWERGGGGAGAEEDYPWRTRLTLSLPTARHRGCRTDAQRQPAGPRGCWRVRLARRGSSSKARVSGSASPLPASN